MNSKSVNFVHAFIISWDGMHEKAKKIANEIYGHVEKLHIIYSNSKNEIEDGLGDWVKIDNKLFFGPKFKKCLDIYQDGIFLLIHADADCADWKGLVNQCQKMNKIESIGIWSPNTFYTGWATEFVEVAKDSNINTSFVVQTDGIVFSLENAVVQRMRGFSYEDNNLGWGIDWAAICYSYCNNKIILRDHNIFVAHQQGSGYQKAEAVKQMAGFLDQLTVQEKLMYKLLSNHVDLAKRNYSGG